MNPDVVEARLRARGLSVTGPRRAIVSHLRDNPHHPTAAQVHQEVSRACPGISRATVYNTLALLVEMGELRPLRQVGRDTRFDPRIEPHHHRACPHCGALADISLTEVEVRWLGALVPAEVRLLAPCEGCG